MTGTVEKRFYRRNLFLLVCAMLCLMCYDLAGGLWLKGLTSGWFVLLGTVNLRFAQMTLKKIPSFAALLVAGLSFGLLADVMLGVQFLAGVLLFALGHVFYLIAFSTLEPLRRRDLCFIVPVTVVSLSIMTGLPWIQIRDPALEYLLLGYTVVIAVMLGKAVSNFSRRKTLFRGLLLLGCAMFWFSDLVLAIDIFGVSNRLTWILCSYVYWPAQNLLAFSLFFYVRELYVQLQAS